MRRIILARLTGRFPRLQTLVFVGLLLVGCVRPGADGREAEASRPNIIFIIADDWSYPHAGVYGDPVVKTPHFDRIARSGILFHNTFCNAPTCTPSRAAILTGQTIHRLKEGANLWCSLPAEFEVYPDHLEAAGYHIGYEMKGWGPGKLGERTRNPAGVSYRNFEAFINSVPNGRPFYYWLGSGHPHRRYPKGIGREAGLDPADVVVPPFMPDHPVVREDMINYYARVQTFDDQVGEVLRLIEEHGALENTMVVVTSDNGMPFNRSKANLYDAGSRMPLAIQWPARIKAGQVSRQFIQFTDFAPTFMEAAGRAPLPQMTGRSFLGLLTGKTLRHRDMAFIEKERHADGRKGHATYPCRAVRTAEFLYIRNLRPERWPAGDPEPVEGSAGGPFIDVDGSPTKALLIAGKDDPRIAKFYELSFAKRPGEELFDLGKDPHQLTNVAHDPSYAKAKRKLRATLDRWMLDTEDPRLDGGGDEFDTYRWYGPIWKQKGYEGAYSPPDR